MKAVILRPRKQRTLLEPSRARAAVSDRAKTLIQFRPYQWEAFANRTNGIEVWMWGRQTGKSFTLAAWAVDRLLTRPGRLVTVLSNSKVNGMELNLRCAEICELLGQAFEQVDLSRDLRFESFNTETRIEVDGKVGRIKVLAANPRTARGFSGDVIFDEFAFQEDAAAIWAAAEPILQSNPDYLGRVASTPNGKHNMFYQLATDPNLPLRRVTRSDAHQQGCAVYHPVTREKITPEQARELASNKSVYDQNYECVFCEQNMALLTQELISAAEREELGNICEGQWRLDALENLREEPVAEAGEPGELKWQGINAPQLYAGIDVGRNHDQTVITVMERRGASYLTRALLRMRDMRMPQQQEQLERVLALPNLLHAKSI